MMPIRRAKKPRTGAGKRRKVERVMSEFKAGTLTSNGRRVTSRAQALAIALNKAGLSRRRSRRRRTKR